MRTLSLLCLAAFLAVGEADIYAVLVAGSNGYWNYRHQADICHAYHVLTDHGVKADNIITLMYDDVANDFENPFPGKLFNKPDGNDVYGGVKIDYSGDDVNPDNFMAILRGDSNAVSGGNGRVLKSNKDDKVFVYFADHGDTGLIAFMDDLLTAQDLNQTLQAMYDKQLYGQLVFYLESCESGSMFEGILPSNVNIFAVTAANADESSWGCYCDDPVLDTCLGDLFSVNWMEDSDVEDLNKETLQQQYTIVQQKTYLSHVMQYGDLTINPEVVSTFQGTDTPKPKLRSARKSSKTSVHEHAKWVSKDIPIKMVESRLKRATEPAKRQQLTAQLADMKMKRAYHDLHTRSLVRKLVPEKEAHEFVLTHKPTMVRDLACHDSVLKAYHNSCFNLGQNAYAMRIAGPLTNLCDRGLGAEKIINTIESHCAHKNARMTSIL